MLIRARWIGKPEDLGGRPEGVVYLCLDPATRTIYYADSGGAELRTCTIGTHHQATEGGFRAWLASGVMTRVWALEPTDPDLVMDEGL
jgi:hypothetical protein